MNDEPIDFTARLEKWRQASAEFSASWRAWSEGQPQLVRCELHGRDREISVDASLRASFVAGKMVAEYFLCPGCKADAAVRAKSGALREAGVLDENVLHATFENFVCRTDLDRANLQTAREYAERRRGFLLMLGPVGTGKSHLAVSIMRAAAGRCRFVTHLRLLKKLRDTYRDKNAEDPVKLYSSVGLLVLDELGLSSGGRDEMPMLHDILSSRHEGRKPTVLTSNLTKEEFKEAVGERMADRLRQSTSSVLMFAGESLRTQFRRDYHEEKKP